MNIHIKNKLSTISLISLDTPIDYNNLACIFGDITDPNTCVIDSVCTSNDVDCTCTNPNNLATCSMDPVCLDDSNGACVGLDGGNTY